ncbi:uncharacterized protein LOC118486468 [Helianthus annuus]|uniref:uncharacterized protein LOC118486468 n=1 Tax=Helianthus annuus TaxID=4232 RepID=UPI001652E24D|nr:uncharacterized protein LOC118486468 [Helianthus annuus]
MEHQDFYNLFAGSGMSVTQSPASIVQNVNMENELGTMQKPPKLMSLDEYAGIGSLTESEQIDFKVEKKMVSILQQAIKEDILVLLQHEDNSQSMWQALKLKFQGSVSMIKSKKALIKKEFDIFTGIKGEMTKQLIERYCHLVVEMKRLEITKTNEEWIDKLCDAHPYDEWGTYLTMLKNNSDFCNIAENIKNGNEITETAAKQNIALLASVLEAYEGLVAGRIGNPDMTKEDYDQIDPEELELIDIKWCMAILVRRAQHFMEITGRNSLSGPDQKLGQAIYHRPNQQPTVQRPQIENKPEKALIVNQDDEKVAAGYFEEPRTGSCPRFEEKKEVVEELIDVSKEMTGEALKDIADKALMGKLKGVDSESEESKSVSSVSVKREESGVQEIKSVELSESESNNVGKTDYVEQKYPDGVEAALNLKLRSIEDDLPENIDITFSTSDTDNESQVIKTVVDQVLDEESEKSEKALSEKVVGDSEEEGNFLDQYIPKSKKSVNDDPIMVSKPSVEFKKRENALKIDSNIFKDDIVEFENEVDKFLDEFPPIINKVKTILKEEVPYVTFDFPKTNEKCDVVFGSVSEGLPKSVLSKWIMDSGASRHMTGTLALLYDVKSINGNCVGFAGNQGGRIVGQGTLSNGVISFDKVN